MYNFFYLHTYAIPMHIFYYFSYEHCNASTHAYIRPPFILFGAKRIALNDDLTCSLQGKTAGEIFQRLIDEKKRKRTDAMMMMIMVILSRHAYMCTFKYNFDIIRFIQWSNLIARQHETLSFKYLAFDDKMHREDND